jgi:cytochrome c5
MRPVHLCPSYCLVLSIALGGCQSSPNQPAAEQPPAAGPPAASTAANARDELILTTAKIGLPPAGITAADLPDPASDGARLVGNFCAQCHDLPSPATHSATDWPSVVRRMWLRMERLPEGLHIAVPDQGDRNTLLTYLTANALKVSGENLPPGPGRAEFSMICSRCHALPDPRVHSAQDWLAVFLRMERNMERMKVAPPSQTQGQEILGYLQSPR